MELIVKEAKKNYGKFFDGAQIKYAEKDEEKRIYKFLVKSKEGVFRFQGKIENQENQNKSDNFAIETMNAVLTNYKDS